MALLSNFNKYLVGVKEFQYKDKTVNAYLLNYKGIPAFYIDQNNANIVYIPDLDLFVPADETILDKIITEVEQQTITAVPENNYKNVNYDVNLYDVIRPPISGRVVYAEELTKIPDLKAVKVVKEPISPDFYRKGYSIIDKRPVEYLNKVDILDTEAFNSRFVTITEPGTYKGFDSSFEEVEIAVLEDLNGKRLVIVDGTKCSNTEKPIGQKISNDVCIPGEYCLEEIPIKFNIGLNTVVRHGTKAIKLGKAKFNFDLNGTVKLISDSGVTIIFRDREKAFKVNEFLYIFPLDSTIIQLDCSKNEVLINSFNTITRYFTDKSVRVRKELNSIIYNEKMFSIPEAIELLAKELLAPAIDIENIINKIPQNKTIRIIVIAKGKPIPKIAEDIQEIAQYLDDSQESLGLLAAALSKSDRDLEGIKEAMIYTIDRLSRLKLLIYIENIQSEEKNKIEDLLNYVTGAFKEL